MEYLSTRDKTLRKNAAQAITMGLSRDGGLFTPVSFPSISALEVETLRGMSYQRRAAYIMGKFLEDFRPEDLEQFAENAYGPDLPALSRTWPCKCCPSCCPLAWA